MGTIYLVSSNGKLSKRGGSLLYTDYDGTQTILPPHSVDQLYVIGTVSITGQALHLLMHKMIEIIFVSKNGRYDGKLVFQDAKNVFLRQKQYERLNDQLFCVTFVKAVVRGKLKNQYLFMQRILRKLDGDKQIPQQVKSLADIMIKLEKVQTIDEIRGYEGYGATLYFSVFARNVIQDWAVFKGRSKNPPKDNVNAVLSFLYTLLAYRIDSLIVSEGLDNAVGILHSMSYGRKSLVFDLMEEFRTPLVDTVVCSLFNLGILKKNEFREVVNDSEGKANAESESTELVEDVIPGEFTRAVLLTQDGLKKVVVQFEKKLQEEHFYEPLGKRLDYKRIMHEQVKMYKRLVMGLEESYKPVVIT